MGDRIRLFHLAALPMGLLSPWLLPFGAAAVRSFAVPAGTRPTSGPVETAVSVLVVVAAALAL